MPETASLDPLADARAQAVRRILELRGETGGADIIDLRGLIARADARAGEANASARELSAVLPTRLEAAIERALAEDAAGIGRRIDAVHSDTEEISDAIARVERDLVAERLGRIEDLEALVALVSSGISAIRADVGRLQARVDELAVQLEQKDAGISPAAEVAATQPPPTQGRRAYRSLFARTEPHADEAESPAEHQQSA
jgi:chromosome segregation ATPase